MTPNRRLHYVNKYKVLGLGHSANITELNRVYRSKVRQHHPDRMHNEEAVVIARSEATLSKLNEAVRELRLYHKAKGRLPFEGAQNESQLATDNRIGAHMSNKHIDGVSGPRGINHWLKVFAIILAIWSAWLIWEG